MLALFVPLGACEDAGVDVEWISETRVKLGAVQRGHGTEVKFTLRNRGGRDVRIVSATPDCSCLKWKYPTKVISPGAKASLTGVVYASGVGSERVETRVVTESGGATTSHLLSVEMFVNAEVGFNRRYLALTSVRPKETLESVFKLFVNGERSAAVRLGEQVEAKDERLIVVAHEPMLVHREPFERWAVPFDIRVADSADAGAMIVTDVVGVASGHGKEKQKIRVTMRIE